MVTGVRLLNCSLTPAKNGRPTREVIDGHVPYVGNVRIFGCEVWMHDPKTKKLDKRAKRGILLRSVSHRNYRVYDIQSRSIAFALHVQINENVIPGRNIFSTGWESTTEMLDDYKSSYEELDDSDSGAEGGKVADRTGYEAAVITGSEATPNVGSTQTADVGNDNHSDDHGASNMPSNANGVEKSRSTSECYADVDSITPCMQELLIHYPTRRYSSRQRRTLYRFSDTNHSGFIGRSSSPADVPDSV